VNFGVVWWLNNFKNKDGSMKKYFDKNNNEIKLTKHVKAAG